MGLIVHEYTNFCMIFVCDICLQSQVLGSRKDALDILSSSKEVDMLGVYSYFHCNIYSR